MSTRNFRWAGLLLAALPFALYAQQGGAPQAGPMAETVFKDIKSFKGVPAKDVIPAMQFMAASMKMECTGCHVENDYAAATKNKDTTRDMIELQREINTKFFNNRLAVTCMSCHNGREHPLEFPIPEGATVRHARFRTEVKPEALFAKHSTLVGADKGVITRTGTLTSPAPGHTSKTSDATMVQAPGGKYYMTSGEGKFGSDGKSPWKDAFPLTDEPAAIFDRIGRAWRGAEAFAGLEGMFISGQEKIGGKNALVVRANRTATGAMEELYFDVESGYLVRMVNVTRSTLGNVVSVYDYEGYTDVKGVKVPMKVTATFAGGEKWIMDFKSAVVSDTVDEKIFKMAGG